MTFKALLAATTTTGILLFAASESSAALINGDVGIGGSALVNTGAKSVDVVAGTSNVLFPGGTGDLAGLTTGTAISFSDFLYGASFAPLTIWSGGGFSFDLQNLSDDTNPAPNFVAVQGSGLLKGAGYDDTPANFTFSANIAGGDAQWRFSSDTAVPTVPEPITLGMLGVGLVGLGMATRRRFK